MSYIGTTEIGGMFLGSTEIEKAYLGTDLVYQRIRPEPIFYSYILFDGNAYIDTDIIIPENGSIKTYVGDEILSSAQRVFGANSSDDKIITLLQSSSTSTTIRYYSGYYDSSSSLGSTSINKYWLNHGLFLTPKKIGLESSSAGTTITKGTAEHIGPLVIGSIGSHTGNPYTGSFNDIEIYGADAQDVTAISGFSSFTPYRTLRPCKYGNSCGLWNVEEGKFYGNSAGSGELIVANKAANMKPSSYDTTNHAYATVQNMSNGYTTADSSNYARIDLTKGANAETYVYFKFDTSAIPENASIKRVVCAARYYISNATATNVATRQIQMFSGTTPKGTALNMTTSNTGRFLIPGTWTREELNDVRIRLYAERGSSNTNSAYYIRFYGATLRVFYDANE